MGLIKPGSTVTISIGGKAICGVRDIDFDAAATPDVTYQLPFNSTTVSATYYVRPLDARRLLRRFRRIQIAERLAQKHSRGLRNTRRSRGLRLPLGFIQRRPTAL